MAGLIVAGVVIAIAVFAVQQWLAQRRRDAVATLAASLGLAYTSGDTQGLEDLPFELFHQGDDQGVENVVWGERAGRRVWLCDFWYYDETTDAKGNRSRQYHRFTCGIASVPATLPRCTIRPEGFLSRLADIVGLDDIELESEEFNRAFNVTTDDRRFAFALVDQPMMAWLLDTANGCRYETSGPLLLCATKRRDPAEWPWALEQLESFCGRIPSVVQSLYPPPGSPPA